VVSETVEFGMAYITGHDRSQLLLLPEAVDDYIGSDNPVRFIDSFVDGLDLAAAGFGRVASGGLAVDAARCIAERAWHASRQGRASRTHAARRGTPPPIVGSEAELPPS